MTLLISVSEVVGITGMNHHAQQENGFLKKYTATILFNKSLKEKY
jgi:hypothetical protein